MARNEAREDRISAARREVREAVDRERARAAIRAAGAREADDAAVDALAALAEERLAEIAARAVENSRERNELKLSAATVAIAAQREAEERNRRRESD